MNARERICNIFNRKEADRVGFWLGMPLAETMEIYADKLGLSDSKQVEDYFDSDMCFVCADLFDPWKHPEGKPAIWNMLGIEDNADAASASVGPLADITSVKEVEALDWPDPQYMDYSQALVKLKEIHPQNKAILSGSWTHFYHIVADLFGMEQYFMKMYTDPEVVEAVTERVVDFFVRCNEKFAAQCGDYFDVFFFGNDFGSQNDLLISPDAFDKFVLPGFKKNIEVAKRFNKPVMLHSCGSINKVIPQLIDAGVDAIHPLQAKAKDMDAESLAKQYRGKVAFVGGVDTQDLLVNATPEEVIAEVRRLKRLLGPDYVVSPSHESLQPDITLENVQAMAKAAKE